MSDGRAYTYTWSNRGQMLKEWTLGYPVRTFSYNTAGQMITATVFMLTTRLTYNGDGARVAVGVQPTAGRQSLPDTLNNKKRRAYARRL